MGRHLHITLTIAALLGAAITGCSAPVARIVHRLPAPLPLEGEVGDLTVGEFRLTDGSGQGVADFAAQSLRDQLARIGAPTSAGPALRVDALIDVVVTDTDTQRMVGQYDADAGEVRPAPAASLVREAAVNVQFMVLEPDGTVVVAEIRRSYDSRTDPATWGELGLNRSDDPEHVPGAEAIVQQLLTESVERFVEMIRPLDVRADVPMRWVGGPDAEKGLAAAEKGDFAAALAHFEAQALDRPDDVDLLFDVAVSAEAAGELDTALAGYEKVVELTDSKDPDAVAGVDRLQRIMPRLGLTD
ncbi:MAG: tetratricopeptide repeat protein [Planctomycetota bacterium]|jgi:hypothetical protein